jgi:UDP-N-acetylmuramoyl-tripeptide--D-alanyl-D-alanine ligase
MPFQIKFSQLAALLEAEILHPGHPEKHANLEGVSTDTRSLEPGQIFVALRGENFDGHQFLEMAEQKGAGVAVVDLQFAGVGQFSRDEAAMATTTMATTTVATYTMAIMQVDNTLLAYQRLAQWWRQQFQIPIIGITGSVGKTTTKELIAATLGTQGKVLKTEANYNNEIGVPKTLLGLGPEYDYGVIEMAMRGPGEIALLCQITQPTIGVITNVGVAHIGRLGSREAIAQAKCELLAQMPQDSVAILNQDQPLLQNTAKTVWSGQTLTFGFTGGDIHGILEDVQTLKVGNQTFTLPLPGEHNGLNFLATLGVAQVLNLDWATLTHLQVQLSGGRCQTYKLPNDITFLDETYNAGPESMVAALKLLAQTPGERHIAVLGTMKELGDRSLEFHTEVGQMVQQLKLNHLLILADEPEAQALTQGAHPIPTTQLSSHEQGVDCLQQFLQPGDRVLFKASRSVALDRVIKAFIG